MLFSLLVERLTSLPTGIFAKVVAYADDVAMVVSRPNHLGSASALLRRLTHECAALGLVISREETSAMALWYALLPEPIDMRGVPVPWVPTHKYLGMTLDARLSFRPYVTCVRGEVLRRTNVMRALTRLAGGASERVLRRINIQAVRSSLDYGHRVL